MIFPVFGLLLFHINHGEVCFLSRQDDLVLLSGTEASRSEVGARADSTRADAAPSAGRSAGNPGRSSFSCLD